MHRKDVLLLLLLFAFYAQSAFPIGRIGNSGRISDPADRYSIAIPKAFDSLTQVTDGGLVLASGFFASNPPVPVDINILPFKSEFPHLVDKGVEAIETYFMKAPGSRYRKVFLPNGALTLIGESATGHTGLSVCGDGRGYVVFGPKLDLTLNGIEELLEQTVFDVPCKN